MGAAGARMVGRGGRGGRGGGGGCGGWGRGGGGGGGGGAGGGMGCLDCEGGQATTGHALRCAGCRCGDDRGHGGGRRERPVSGCRQDPDGRWRCDHHGRGRI